MGCRTPNRNTQEPPLSPKTTFGNFKKYLIPHGTTWPNTQNISDCGEGHLLEFDHRMALISPGYSTSIFLKLSQPCTMNRIPKNNVWEFKTIPYATWDNLALYPKYKSLWEGSTILVCVWMCLISLEYSAIMLLQLFLS